MLSSLPPGLVRWEGPTHLPWSVSTIKSAEAVFIDIVVNTCVTGGLLSTQCVSVVGVKDERPMTSGCQQEVQLVIEV